MCSKKIKHYTTIEYAESIFKQKFLKVHSTDKLNQDSVFNAKGYNETPGEIKFAEGANCYIVFEWEGPCQDFCQREIDKFPPDKWGNIINSVLYHEISCGESFRYFIRGPINKKCSLKFIDVCEWTSNESIIIIKSDKKRIKKLSELCKNKNVFVQIQEVY